jgi:uncharacterized protein (TIGR02599 family)
MNRNDPRFRTRVRWCGAGILDRGFTLVELLLSMVILSLVTLVLVSMVNQTGSLWHRTTSKIEEFREARTGFESLTRCLSQATLNTYWDYNDPNVPTKYMRQSELRFISGPGLLAGVNSPTPYPTQSLFFFAPLGFVRPASATDTASANYQGLDNLLNLWGYFIEYADDSALRPPFVNGKPHKRFRLMELMQPSQSLSIYSLETQAGGNLKYVTPDWFQNAVSASGDLPRPAHVLAENIIALIVLPKMTPADQKKLGFNDASLAPNYFYNSTGLDLTGSTKLSTTANPTLNGTHQLPPVMEVAMVAIDETSAALLSDADALDLQAELAGLFADPKKLSSDLTGKPTPPATGLSLEDYLRQKRINYRVFTTDVSIRAAKWSSNQKN